MQLYIAYKNYSSWSLRPWIALKVKGVTFEETVLPFHNDDALDQFGLKHQIPAKAPVLIDNGLVIWDSMAILEYLAEQYPERGFWPQEKNLRSLARSAAAEMHSSFFALRSTCPMNCRKERRVPVSAEVEVDLKRLAEIWQHFEQAKNPAGDFLCGEFCNVDAMYAPVMWRVRNYGLKVSPAFDRWVQAMYELPEMQEWLADAKAEEAKWVLPQYED